MSLSETQRARYSRHLLLPEIGMAGQQRLQAARVLVVGAGGLGSPAALYLAAADVGTLGIIDNDRVELSNLQRQVLFDSASVGQLKAEAARARLAALNPDITVIAHPVELRAGNAAEILSGYDMVLDGSDRLSTRYLVNDACVIYKKTLVSAAIHRFEGQALSYVPGKGPCYRCLFSSSAEGVVPNCAEAGVLVVLPGVMGSIQATEAIKLITGIGAPLVGRLLTYDALEMRVREFRFARRVDCAVCGDHATIAALQETPAALCAADIPGLRSYSPPALRALLQERGDSGELLLIDVRDAAEFAAGHIAGARNMPLAQLEQQLGELHNASGLIFICLAGTRSLQACRLAATHELPNIGHLEGGMRAWQSLYFSS